MSYKLTQNYLTPNKWSRPQKPATIEWICIHWEAVVNARAESVRNFFENRKYGNDGYGSAHEILDTDGSVLQVIPNDEMAYSVGSSTYTSEKYKMMGNTYPNSVVYSIEAPTINMEGDYSNVVYRTMVERVVDLLIENNLDLDKVTNHGILTGKDCPKYYCPHYDTVDYGRWNVFLGDIKMEYDEKVNEDKPDQWAEEAWNWGIENDITDGTRPKDDITRQEVMQMLYNYDKKGE